MAKINHFLKTNPFFIILNSLVFNHKFKTNPVLNLKATNTTKRIIDSIDLCGPGNIQKKVKSGANVIKQYCGKLPWYFKFDT